jgi:dolichyl-diphosphooligosaccharide---protein glycosyltransferase
MAEKGKVAAPEKGEQKSGGFLSNIRLTRANALEVAALGIILAVAIILRIMPMRWGEYLNEYDPYFWYRITEHIVQNGYASYFTWHDTLSWFPQGRDIAISSYPGNPFSAAFIYNILHALGLSISVLQVCLYFPVLMSVIVCIVAYFFGKDFGGKATGIFTALFMAINPSYLSRTVAGFFDTENIGIFGMIATPFFFLRSIRKENSLPKSVIYAVASGLAMGYAFASWGAARYISSLLLLYIGVMLVMGKIEKRHIISYSITTIIGFLICIPIPRLGLSYVMNIENLAALSAIVLLVLYEAIKTRLPESQARLSTIGLVALGVVAIIVFPYFGIGNPVVGKFAKVLNPFAEASTLYTSVGENQVSSWDIFFTDFGITIFLAVLGAYMILKEGGENRYYALIFFLTSVYFTGTVVRLSLILAFPASLLAAYALVKVVESFKTVIIHKEDTQSKRRKAEAFAVSKGLSILFIVLLLGSLVPYTMNAAASATTPGPIVYSGVPVFINGTYVNDWLETLTWLKANTPQDSIVCSWWDYGYWIEGMANRTTLADGSTSNRTQIGNIAQMFIKPQNESLPIMQKYKVDYVIVYVTFNPNTGSEWAYGDNAKWTQMARIAGYNLTDFYVYDSTKGSYSYTTKFTNSTIANLMYGLADKAHFTLVHQSKTGWVLVYKVTY